MRPVAARAASTRPEEKSWSARRRGSAAGDESFIATSQKA
jgi:hypothetical protein